MFPSVLSVCVCVVAALVPSTVAAPPQVKSTPTSPCPNLFHYDSVNDPGRWTGNLVLDSEDDLHGVWIRVIFDRQPGEVTAEGFEVVKYNGDGYEVLIKNKDVLLKAGSLANVKLTVKYDGDKFPSLIGYRLNAKTVCPEYNIFRRDFFEGDDNSRNFLSLILSKAKPTAYKPAFECGLKRSDVYPWQASVSITKDDEDQYICDATLISASHVILPAHCVTFNNDVERIPPTILSVTLAGTKETFKVKKTTVHRGYDPNTLSDDVAVLELNTALKVNDNVRPICLDNSRGDIGSYVLVGKALGADGRISGEVQEKVIPAADINDCSARNAQLDALLGDNSFCVAYPPENSGCIGNSGSSIVSRANNINTLRGIVVLGPSLQNKTQCNKDSIAIGVDLARYFKWILHSIS